MTSKSDPKIGILARVRRTKFFVFCMNKTNCNNMANFSNHEHGQILNMAGHLEYLGVGSEMVASLLNDNLERGIATIDIDAGSSGISSNMSEMLASLLNDQVAMVPTIPDCIEQDCSCNKHPCGGT